MMSKLKMTFFGYRINNLEYKIKEMNSIQIESEHADINVGNISFNLTKDRSILFSNADVSVKTEIVDNNKNKYDYREIKFKYLCRFSIEVSPEGTSVTLKQIEDIMRNGGFQYAISHLRDVIKNVTSLDDRTPLYPSDNPITVDLKE